MKLNEIIVDADFCIKVGASSKYRYLEQMLPLIADKAYIHGVAYNEILIPASAKEQIQAMIKQGSIEVVSEENLSAFEKNIYDSTYHLLAKAMIDPNNPKKNIGEVSSLAMAKTKSIPYFVTDEMNLQPIVDKLLNTGMEDITCIRIIDIVNKIKSGELKGFYRKEAKRLWILSMKDKNIFDSIIWPI
jgi:hypothetical protein